MSQQPHISQATEPKGCLFRQSQHGEYDGAPMCALCNHEPQSCPFGCTYFDQFGNPKE